MVGGLTGGGGERSQHSYPVILAGRNVQKFKSTSTNSIASDRGESPDEVRHGLATSKVCKSVGDNRKDNAQI